MSSDDELTYYASGEEVSVESVRLEEQDAPNGGGTYWAWYPTVRFEDGSEHELHSSQLRAEGGLSAIAEDFTRRGLVPEEFFG